MDDIHSEKATSQGTEPSPPHLVPTPPSLRAAIRKARVEQAERSEVVAELRGAELARLEMLFDAMKPVLAQTPDDVDLFDAGVVPGERPRLFVDMIAFVEMGHDKRLYRFVQETRHGRVLLAESARIDTMVDALTAYIARRLVERQQALAADPTVPLWRGEDQAPATAVTTDDARRADERRKDAEEAVRETRAGRWRRRFSNWFVFTVELLGSVTLFVLVVGAGYLLARLIETWWRSSAF